MVSDLRFRYSASNHYRSTFLDMLENFDRRGDGLRASLPKRESDIDTVWPTLRTGIFVGSRTCLIVIYLAVV